LVGWFAGVLVLVCLVCVLVLCKLLNTRTTRNAAQTARKNDNNKDKNAHAPKKKADSTTPWNVLSHPYSAAIGMIAVLMFDRSA
jgi:ABC-type protease/lipase transport system fused ATPase/permease subunit